MTRSDVGWQDLKFKSGHKLYWQLFLQINKNNCLNFKEGENTQNQCVVKTLINLYGYDRRFYLVFLVSIFLCDLFLIWIKFHVMVSRYHVAAPLLLVWRLSEGRRSSDKFNNKEAKADTEVITIISYQRAAVWLHHWLRQPGLDDVSQVLEVTRGGFLFLPWLGNFEEVRRKRREREGGCFDQSNDHHLDAVLSCRGFSFYQMGSNLIERDPSAAVPSDVMWDKADERLAHLPPPYQSLLFTFIWSSLHIEDVRQGNPVIGKHSLWSEFSIKRFEKIISTSSHPSLPDTLMIARLSPSIIDTATTEITFPSEELKWECWEVLIPYRYLCLHYTEGSN